MPFPLGPPCHSPWEESKTEFPGGLPGAGGAHQTRLQRSGCTWWETRQPRRRFLFLETKSEFQLGAQKLPLPCFRGVGPPTVPGSAAAATGASPKRRGPATLQSQGQSQQREASHLPLTPSRPPAARAPTVSRDAASLAASFWTEPHTCDPAAPPPRRLQGEIRKKDASLIPSHLLCPSPSCHPLASAAATRSMRLAHWS